MFLLRRLHDSQIQTILARQRDEEFSYPDAGASRGQPPAGYAVLRGRVDLGRGSETFARAVQALRRWKMFEVRGVRLCWPDAPIQPRSAVAIVVRHFGFWSLNFCKIVYVIDEHGPRRRFGFAYGTLREHAEQGEERFTVEWDRASELVSYDILSFSRAGSLAVKAAYPVTRWLQRRFVRDSLAAMADAVRTE
jgi:uncharacterized protein (UPF0548 family)